MTATDELVAATSALSLDADGTSTKRLDVHMHICPPALHAAMTACGMGMPPVGTLKAAKDAMRSLGTQRGILSCSVPGPAAVAGVEEGRLLARQCNEEILGVVEEGKTEEVDLGYWAGTPNWVDVKGAIREIEWALDKPQRDRGVVGIVVVATYAGKLLGDPFFTPIWETLDRLEAVVFIHPTFAAEPSTPIAGTLPPFIAEFPLQTTRTAYDLVLTGTLSRFKNVRVLLPHAGGAVPVLADKILASLGAAGEGVGSALEDQTFGREEILDALRRFYYDTALSTGTVAMHGLAHFAQHDRVVYGSDCTFCTPTGVPQAMAQQLEDWLDSEDGRKSGLTRQAVMYENAQRLLL
ncbi:hypothetical protein CYLTODRAFT_398229 [Cylindrobasidium torrendii FP15055 ss-10]|uniref:6-methylsalicylate decarboxylase n=1 Tax=Cylindrobasidium torrendii FP15055 ss-10 TaxID=1314674 RepID=A0A0D7BBA0_9AGAR|nr:hypothetical protein CYLTODRAFT_398229 [Cylindrobasidium torrendii FP15055 ss-10]